MVSLSPMLDKSCLLYGAGKFFFCRHCYDLTYGSQHEGKTERLTRKADNIRIKLGGQAGSANPFPDKPKNMMHWKTYWRLRNEAELAEDLAHNDLQAAYRRGHKQPERLLVYLVANGSAQHYHRDQLRRRELKGCYCGDDGLARQRHSRLLKCRGQLLDHHTAPNDDDKGRQQPHVHESQNVVALLST